MDKDSDGGLRGKRSEAGLDPFHVNGSGEIYLNKTESDVVVKLFPVLWTVEGRDGDCC